MEQPSSPVSDDQVKSDETINIPEDIGNVDKDGRDDDMETASLSEVRSYDVLEMNVNTLKLTFRVSAY